jgi:hypothetical protein
VFCLHIAQSKRPNFKLWPKGVREMITTAKGTPTRLQ